MRTEQPIATDFGVVDRMLDAIERGDMEQLRACFATGAESWHNSDEATQTVDETVGLISYLCTVSTSRSYQDRRVTTAGSQAFLQHTLTAVLKSGNQLRMPAMMRIVVNADGLVERLEEYLDSRDVDCLAEEQP